jgi:hypothetical protein
MIHDCDEDFVMRQVGVSSEILTSSQSEMFSKHLPAYYDVQ